jgi:hypothetical protein
MRWQAPTGTSPLVRKRIDDRDAFRRGCRSGPPCTTCATQRRVPAVRGPVPGGESWAAEACRTLLPEMTDDEIEIVRPLR